MNQTIRVFAERTSYTPTDDYVFIGLPPFDCLIPPHTAVHISCIFSWHKEYCLELQKAWQQRTDKTVLVGGPAFGSEATNFTQGMYIRSNVIFTSRGCNNNCPFCIVPKIEGKLQELPICEGNIIQDNNFLQTSKAHKQKVFAMLKKQSGICFKGGLQADLITEEIADEFAKLRIKELWLACDADSSVPKFLKAMEILNSRGLGRNGRTKSGYINCYCLIGDDMDKNEQRLRTVYNAGAMPFAQLLQPIGAERKKIYSKDWQKFHCMWCRPAATVAHMEKGTNYWEF